MLTVLYLLFTFASLSHLFRVQGYPCCKVCHEKTQTGVDIAFKVPYQLIASLFRFILFYKYRYLYLGHIFRVCEFLHNTSYINQHILTHDNNERFLLVIYYNMMSVICCVLCHCTPQWPHHNFWIIWAYVHMTTLCMYVIVCVCKSVDIYIC